MIFFFLKQMFNNKQKVPHADKVTQLFRQISNFLDSTSVEKDQRVVMDLKLIGLNLLLYKPEL